MLEGKEITEQKKNNKDAIGKKNIKIRNQMV